MTVVDRSGAHEFGQVGDSGLTGMINEFFSLMLDPTMIYSSGVFSSPNSTLEEASREKYDRICQKLQLTPQDHVPEIGTGWLGG